MNERTVRIRGGERVTVRPMTSADAAAVLAGFDHLSAASLRHRFFSPVVRLTPGVVADLTTVDDQHLVLLAFEGAGQLLGGARATRRRGDPSVAEVAVTVGDEHGLSYYSDASLGRLLSLRPDEVQAARRQLVAAALLAHAKPLYQVLALAPAESGLAGGIR